MHILVSVYNMYPDLGRLDAFIFLDLRPSSLHSGAGLMPASRGRLLVSPTIGEPSYVSTPAQQDTGVRFRGY